MIGGRVDKFGAKAVLLNPPLCRCARFRFTWPRHDHLHVGGDEEDAIEALKKNPTLAGNVDLTFALKASGEKISSSHAGSTVPDEVAWCILQKVQGYVHVKLTRGGVGSSIRLPIALSVAPTP